MSLSCRVRRAAEGSCAAEVVMCRIYAPKDKYQYGSHSHSLWELQLVGRYLTALTFLDLLRSPQ